MADSPLPVELRPFLPASVRTLLESAATAATGLEEVRLREGRPLQVVCHGMDAFISPQGRLTQRADLAYRPDQAELQRTFQAMARGSVYAWEDEIRGGFLTLPGGHRVGLAGRVVTEEGRIRTIKQVGSLNLRVAREVTGCATPLIAQLCAGDRLPSTLIISPPQAGKTTLLRDLIRQISAGVESMGLRGRKVGVVDERSELAACAAGIPTRDLGPRTDVLDNCPKAEGMMLLIRSMSPAVVAIDEIGRPADAQAALEAVHAGVVLLATAHGADLAGVMKRPAMAELFHAGLFERAVLISRRRGPGTLERVIDLSGGGERIAG